MTTEPTAPGLAPADPAADAASPPGGPFGRKHQAALGFIFATALMDITAIGIIIPVLPMLVKQFTGGDVAHAARYVGMFGFIFAGMQFVAAPIIGGLSDRFGRRPVLLVSIFGLGLDYVFMALAPSLAWLFVGRIISGATAASFSTAQAYVADITPPEKRAANFGLMGAAFGVGFVIGPSLGGLLGHFSPRAPFWAAGALALANGLYGVFILPESLPRDRRSPFSWSKANPLGSFRLYRSNPQLLGLAGVVFLFYLAQQVLQSTMVLYTTTRYHWDTTIVGLSLALTGVGSILVQSFVTKRFVARYGERGALYAGLFSGMVGFFIYATAPTGTWYWLGAPVFALFGLTGPGFQGLMSRMVDPRQQGRLQGANSGLMAMAGLMGPLVFTSVFAWSISPGPGRPQFGLALYLAGGLLLAALLLAVRAARTVPLRSSDERRAAAAAP